MRRKFDEQLFTLNQELMRMAAMIEENIQKAVEAMVRQDVEAAAEIVEADENVDRMQKKIEQICFELLMRQQPVATDLRVISSTMKMVTDMERVGDHATDIAEITKMMAGTPYHVNMDTLKQMASESMMMLIHSVESYVEKSAKKAQDVIDYDDVVDDLYVKFKDEMIAEIRKGEADAEQVVDLLIVAKYFERIADHSTNIGKWVLFMLGEDR